jgi:hypothetical protein
VRPAYFCDTHMRVPSDEVEPHPHENGFRHTVCGDYIERRLLPWEMFIVDVDPSEPLRGRYAVQRTPELDAIEWGLIHLARWAAPYYRMPGKVQFSLSRGPHDRWFQLVAYTDSMPGQLVFMHPVHVAVNEAIFAMARWAQRWMKWPHTVHGAEGKVDEWQPASDGLVHRAARHPETTRYGSWATPPSLSATACSVCRFDWLEKVDRTFLKARVTCPTCLSTFENNPVESPDWMPRPSYECETLSLISSASTNEKRTQSEGGR